VENRAECVERLWRDERKDLAQVRGYLSRRSARAEYFLQARDIAGIGIMQRSSSTCETPIQGGVARPLTSYRLIARNVGLSKNTVMDIVRRGGEMLTASAT
jgi:hypothetical protein